MKSMLERALDLALEILGFDIPKEEKEEKVKVKVKANN